MMYNKQQLEAMTAKEVLKIAVANRLPYFTYKPGVPKSVGKRNKRKAVLINLILRPRPEQVNIYTPFKPPAQVKTKTREKKIKRVPKMVTGSPGGGKIKIKRRYVIDVDAYVTKRK